MGNFHCIPNGCGRVVYREYLPPSIRYRYEGEDWVYVDGDDYAIDNEIGKCPVLYHAFGTYIDKTTNYCNQTLYWRTAYAVPGNNITSWEPEVTAGNYWAIIGKDGTEYGIRVFREDLWNARYLRNERLISLGYHPSNYPCQNTNSSKGHSAIKVAVLRQDGLSDNCGDCTLTITKNGAIVHEETRDVCPEVEKLDCRLSDEQKIIEVEKLPWLSAISVLEFGRDSMQVDGVPYPLPDIYPIPEECLNIYRDEIWDVLPDADTPDSRNYVFDDNNFGVIGGDYIKQICSAKGCPPPEYHVECNCDCEECPPGTCPVECDGHICCYDEGGLSVKEIAVEDYCGGTP